jgi:hypothetical protein
MAATHRPHPVHSLRAAAGLFFRHVSPALLGLQLLAAAVARVLGGPLSWAELIVVGFVAVYWPVQEYALHRHMLHFRPKRWLGMKIDPLACRYHRHHHSHPWQLRYTFLPPRLIAVLIPIHVLVWWAATPTWETALTGILMFGGATLSYEWIHFLTHTAYRPRTKWMRTVVRRHRWHHFKNERYWFAFIVPMVDSLFLTDPEPGDVTTSPTCRDLQTD